MEPPLPFLPKSRGRVASGRRDAQTWAKHDNRDDGCAVGGSEMMSNSAREMEFVSLFSETLARHLENVKKEIFDGVGDMLKCHGRDMRETNGNMSNIIRTEIAEMKNIISLMNRSGRPCSGKVANKTSLRAWEKTLDELTPHAKLIFCKDVFSRVLSYNVPVKAVEVYRSLRRQDPRTPAIIIASTVMQVLLFSLQPKERKRNLSEGIGELHSELKYAVVHNAFYNVCKNRFALFRAPDMSQDRDGLASLQNDRPEQDRINRPEWLEVGFVSTAHIDSARALVESPNQSRRSKIRGTPTPSDIASHGALRVYRLLGAHLHNGREYVRYAFFQGVGYLFVPWKEHVSDADQCSMKMKLMEDEDDFDLDLDDLPVTTLCPAFPTRQASDHADKSNIKLLRTLFSEWPGMVLEVEHEVHVVPSSGSQRRHSGGEKKVLKKYINLIEVACEIIVEYSRIGSLNLYMRKHIHALKCVIIIAIVFRELFAVYIDLVRSNASELPSIDEIKAHGITLKDLIPGLNCRGSVLESKCLRLTEKEYLRFNQTGDDGLNEVEEGESTFQMAQIEEDPAFGVAAM